MTSDWLPGPRILVLGAGASGTEAARFLRAAGREVTVADDLPESKLPNAPRLREWRVSVRPSDVGLLADTDLVVASPGVPPSAPLVDAARRRGVPLWGELELGYRALGEPADRILAVTGTKGKSSTVTMLAAALRNAGMDARAAGNLGTPLTALAGTLPDAARVVVEASSFQLAATERFRAGIAVMLAVTEDHLDWHPNVEHYRGSKARLLETQAPGDWAVYDGADPVAESIARAAAARTGASLLPFGGTPGSGDPEVVLADRRIRWRDVSGEQVLADLSGLGLAGPHQGRNLAAAAAAATLAGAARSAIEAAAAGFGGLPHALEELPPVGGVRFVNDSRATNVDATRAALRALRLSGDPRVHLILGGILKGGRFAELAPDLGAVAVVHAIGSARPRILRELPARPAASLDEAVETAFAEAAPGDVVLLSPGCSSFDDFRDYRHRGERFRALAARAGGGR